MASAGRICRRAFASLAMVAAIAAPDLACAQNVQRQQSYVMSDEMRHDLDERQFDSARVERIVNGISEAASAEDLGPILDASAANIRITDASMNKVVDKKDLAAFKSRLFADGHLAAAVADESRFILRSESIGVAGGEFWLSEDCLDAECVKKKTQIVTINLP